MADVAGLLAEFQKGIEGKDTGLGATVKFDFEGAGCIFLDGKSNPNTVSDEDNLGRPNIYWRLVRPQEKGDIGPLHRDSWFWELNDDFPTPKYDFYRLKVWLPIFTEIGLNGLLLEPFSQKRVDIKWSGEKRHGINKPTLIIVFFIPLTIIVISPIISLSLKNSITSLIFSPTCSSNFFVNSLATIISRLPPQKSSNSFSNFLSLLGDS